MGSSDISFSTDQTYISNLHGNQTYMAPVSPWFFTVRSHPTCIVRISDRHYVI